MKIIKSKKTVVVLLFAILVPLSLSAQDVTSPSSQDSDNFITVDWAAINKTATEHPEVIKELVSRFVATTPATPDTTLSYEDFALAFYGQSYICNDKEALPIMEMTDSIRSGNYVDAARLAKEVLKINPMSLDAYVTLTNIAYLDRSDSTKTPIYSELEMRTYMTYMVRILYTIAATGDGSVKHPFFVTKISDEYNFMRYFFNLWDYKDQFISSECPCDGFELAKTSKSYSRPNIFFETTRVSELEMKLFGE
jgi:hypothetical protein